MTRWPSPTAWFVVMLPLLLCGCDRLDMYDQPRYEPLEVSHFFPDKLSARQPVEGTIARGHLREDDAFFTGKADGKEVAEIPDAAYRAVHQQNPKLFAASYDDTPKNDLRRALLHRGRERFDIYCSVCHGRTGDGKGMIVQRGFRAPPAYTVDRLMAAPNGHLFDVATNGIGAMAGYASRISVADRWAIVAYIRALQLSQHVSEDTIAEDLRSQLNSEPDATPPQSKEDSR